MFSQSSANPYLAANNEKIKEDGEKLGYKVTVYEANFSPSEQDQQVQQFLASGAKPSAIVWWPAAAEAQVGDVRQLSQVAPVFQTDQPLIPQEKPYVKLYAGVSGPLMGEESAQLLLKLREEDRADGRKLHSPEGNLLVFGFPTGYLQGEQREEAFIKATEKEPFNLLHYEPTVTPDVQGGFNAANTIIPQYQGQGIDYILAMNGEIAIGVARVLKQDGLTPGKDVIISGGNCPANLEVQKTGELSASVLQGSKIEAGVTIRAIEAYMNTEKVLPGVHRWPASKNAEPPLTAGDNEPPHVEEIMPAGQLMGASLLEKPGVWGETPVEACAG